MIHRISVFILILILCVSTSYAEFVDFDYPVWEVAFTPDGSLAVITSLGPDIYLMDTESRQIEREIQIGQPTVAVAVHPSGDYAYLAGSTTLFKLDLNDYSMEPIYSPLWFVSGMTITPDGDRLFVSNTGRNEVLVFQLSDDQLIRRIPVNYPYELKITTDYTGDVFWVCSYRDHRIYRYNLDTYMRSLQINVDAPKALAFTAGGEYIWVVTDGNIGRVSWIREHQVREQFPVQPDPNDLVATEDTVYTVSNRGVISKLNTNFPRTVSSQYVGGRLLHVTKNPAAHELFITRVYQGYQLYILDISPKPALVLEPANVDFGEVEYLRSASAAITLANDGGADLMVTGLTVDNDQLAINCEGSLTIPPGESQVLELTFLPEEVGAVKAVLTIVSNDPDAPEATVEITGSGVWVPADELLERLVDYVTGLQAEDVLNRGQANSLITQLEHAITRLHRERLNQALNMLNAFQNHVTGFMDAGVLDDRDGGSLLTESSFIINLLTEFGIAGNDRELSLRSLAPDEYFLSPAYPNPFNSSTTLSFGLPEAELVQITVYDLSGKIIETIQDSNLGAGRHRIEWQAGEIPAGVYLIKFSAGSFQEYIKVALVR